MERVENLSNRDFGIESSRAQNQLWKFSIESIRVTIFQFRVEFRVPIFEQFLDDFESRSFNMQRCWVALKNHQNWQKN